MDRLGKGGEMRRVAWVLVAVAAWGGRTPAQLPAVPLPTTSTTPAPAAMPAPVLPPLPTAPAVPGGKDYFGPPLSSKFDDKTAFPDTPPALKPADSKDPPPRPIVLSDGTILPPPPPLGPPPKLWTGGFEIGLNGSQGNADVFNLRVGANADRKSDDNRFHTDLLYTENRESGVTKANQGILNSRDEVLLGRTPWAFFTALQVEYDQFRDYDFRVGTYAGMSYRWIKSDNTFLSSRLGAGAVRELSHSPLTPDRWVPEALMGGDFNHRFSDRQAFVSSTDFYPNLSQIGQYRVRARAAYEIVIDPRHHMLLRLGVQDRYDSSPGTALRNDVNYFTTLMFKF